MKSTKFYLLLAATILLATSNSTVFAQSQIIHDAETQRMEKEFGEQTSRPKLDKKYLMILKEISNNCRVSSLELSEKIKLSALKACDLPQ